MILRIYKTNEAIKARGAWLGSRVEKIKTFYKKSEHQHHRFYDIVHYKPTLTVNVHLLILASHIVIIIIRVWSSLCLSTYHKRRHWFATSNCVSGHLLTCFRLLRIQITLERRLRLDMLCALNSARATFLSRVRQNGEAEVTHGDFKQMSRTGNFPSPDKYLGGTFPAR